MNTLFISDLHLEEERPNITELFLKFLENHSKRHASALYILGDFFEVWIGDDNIAPFNQSIIHALRKATDKGLPIYFMHGNRDFLLGKRFLRASGCKLLPDEHVLNLANSPTLLLHGDMLCTADIKYLKFRKKSRNWLLQKIFLFKPLRKRQAIANNYRQASKIHTSTMPDHIMDVTQSEVERIMQKYHVQHLIHGHTHRPGVHHFELCNMPATRTVLGPWHEHGSALLCDEKGNKELIHILS